MGVKPVGCGESPAQSWGPEPGVEQQSCSNAHSEIIPLKKQPQFIYFLAT